MGSFKTECILAGVLFITATATTMAGQMILDPILAADNVLTHVAGNRNIFLTGVLLELMNALASVGIAIALYPIIWSRVQVLAVGYLSFRIIEACLGVLAVVSLLLLLSAVDSNVAVSLHDHAFLLLLMVFSLGTLFLYPLLYRYRLVPRLLSVWGLAGGMMLLLSTLLILFGVIEFGSATDTILSLPIWINEMALALWLIFRGVALHNEPAQSVPVQDYAS